MANQDDLEKLKKKLYKNSEYGEERNKRENLRPLGQDVRTYWKQKSTHQGRDSLGAAKKEDFKSALESLGRTKKNFVFWTLILLVVFLVGGGLFLYLWGEELIWGGNVVSSKKIEIVVEGPSLIESGQQNRWHIFITNNNEVVLEMADLIVEYPEGSLSFDGEDLLKERMTIENISSGGTVDQEVSFFVVGEKDQEKEIKIVLEYRMEGSNAIFAKSVDYQLKLSKPPVGVSLSLPNELESGRQISVNVKYVSNSDVVLKDVYLKMRYPPGFQFQESSLEPIKNKDTWFVGDLLPREERSVEIQGILEGQDLMEVTFEANIGFEGERELITFGSGTASVLLKRPFLGLEFLINGKNVDKIYSDQRFVNVTVPWRNNLFTEIHNVVFEVKLNSEVVDFQSLSVNSGFYRAYDNTVVWNSSSSADLKSVVPNQSSNLSFGFSLKPTFPIKNVEDRNFVINLDGEMSGLQINENGKTSTIRGSVSKEIKIASNARLTSGLFHSSGSFPNFGPLPPRAGQQTTYTVTWSVSNFYNDISGVVVRASLPPYVSWLGVVDSPEEKIIYSASTGELVWEIGGVSAGTGVLRPIKEVSFQVGFQPGLNQINTSPMLISASSLEAEDEFTGLILRDSADLLNTGSVSESQFDYSWGIVVP